MRMSSPGGSTGTAPNTPTRPASRSLRPTEGDEVARASLGFVRPGRLAFPFGVGCRDAFRSASSALPFRSSGLVVAPSACLKLSAGLR